MRIPIRACVVGLVVLAGCVDRARVNDRCEWQDTAFPLDVNDRAHQRHLIADVRVAEEIGIRAGDSVRPREGIAASLRTREACTAVLFAEIARFHTVGADDIARARRHRDLRIDAAAVLLPMALLFVAGTYYVAGRLRQRFPTDEWPAALVATLLLSVIVSGFALAIGDLWSWLVESIRLGNTHLSYRAAYRLWRPYREVIFATGVITFWLIAIFRSGTAWLGTSHRGRSAPY
jgi:hypothetical protein